MLLAFKCPQCDSELEVDGNSAGLDDECPNCGRHLTIPEKTIDAGTTVGNFRIDRKIGAGGMGDVFLATQVSMDRKVALKVLPPALVRDRQFVDRFQHEIRTAARLEHPNIVTAFESGEDSGFYYLAMSYVDGISLDRELEAGRPMPERQSLEVVRSVAEALAYAWREHHILHRDIKPANIMIDRTGKVKLMDLGISKNAAEDSNLTVTGMVVGTPHYMSPEQARGEKGIDFRSDIYALGATLYHMVTGNRPYTGTSAIDVITRHLTEPLPDPTLYNPKLSAPVCRLLQLMLAKRPESRHSSWESLIADIDRVRGGEMPTGPVAASPQATGDVTTPFHPPDAAVTVVDKPPTPRLRRVRRLALAAVAVVAIALLAAGAMRLWDRQASRANVLGPPPSPLDEGEAGPAGEGRGIPPSRPGQGGDRWVRRSPLGSRGRMDMRLTAEEIAQLRTFMDQVAIGLRTGDLAGVRKLIADTVSQHPGGRVGERAAEMIGVVDELEAIPDQILKTFEQDVGKTVTVGLKQHKAPLRVVVREVRDGKVIADRKPEGMPSRRPGLAENRIEITFDQLDDREVIERLDRVPDSRGARLKRGILVSLTSETPDEGEKSITEVPEDLRASLRNLRDRRDARRGPPPATE